MSAQASKPTPSSLDEVKSALQDELAQTDRGVLMLTMEMENLLEEKAARLAEAHDELRKTNSELVALTMELESRVEERTRELEAMNAALEREIEQRNVVENKVRDKARHLQSVLDDLKKRNEELEQFAYVASHDLQEPLRMVASYTQLLAERYKGKLDEKAERYIGYAVDGATRMQRLIEALLAFSRITTHGAVFADVDSQQALAAALSNLEALIQRSGAEVTNDNLPEVRADSGQLTRVFQDLVGNALKFRSKTPPRIHVRAEPDGSSWRFSVRDNGIGIDPQYAERVFVIFQRLHSRTEYPGTGIGLALCKRIIERHGGRIWFDCREKQGTTFHFTLPRT